MPHQRVGPFTSTSSAVSLRTNGSANNNVGKATNHETAHAPSHCCQKSVTQPRALNVLIKDTMQVINTDSSNGITQPA